VATGGSTLRATGRVRRRKRINFVMEALATLSAVIAVGLLGLLVVSVFLRGISGLSLDLFIHNPAVFGQSGGGLKNAFVGSAILVAVATAMALPIGVLVAIYLNEFAPRGAARLIRLGLDVLNGVPSVVVGLFIFGLLVVGSGQKGLYGSIALAVIMLPLVARSAQEVLALVPSALREAGLALGVRKWRIVLGVVLPVSFSGILTGTTLAVARAAGETAPLIFTSSIAGNALNTDPVHQALASVPFAIFEYSEAPDPALHAQAWAAAFVLICFVLLTSLSARLLLARSRRKLERRS
jgi:phosphate transport system permease protein